MPEQPTTDLLRRLVRDALRADDDLDLRPVNEGGEHSTWYAGSRHIVRLALTAECSERQAREIAVRDAIRPRLTVQVPASVAHGEWTPGPGYGIDLRLPGSSAEQRPVSAAGEQDLGEFLAELRAVPVEDSTALGVPTEPARSPDRLRGPARRAAARLAAVGHVDPALPAGLEHLTAPASATVNVLVHNDLKGEHLLVSAPGRVRCVLDWENAAIGDPAEDVAGLAISVGAPAALRAAQLAGHHPDVGVRGLALARCDTVLRLARRLTDDTAGPLPLLRNQLSRAWRPAPLDTDGALIDGIEM